MALTKALLAVDFQMFALDGAPVDGVNGTGAGQASPNALLRDVTTNQYYVNARTIDNPKWEPLGLNPPLPTVDPEVVGQLWNDNGVVVVSSGPGSA